MTKFEIYQKFFKKFSIKILMQNNQILLQKEIIFSIFFKYILNISITIYHKQKQFIS